MPRYKLTVEYDGTPYVGWQRQENGHAVQGAIEQAFKKFCGEDLTLSAAGRTDAGVHATAQVAHVDLAKDWGAGKVRDAVNAHLVMADERISILNVEKTTDTFDARFSARARHYLYRIHNRRAPLAVDYQRAWWVQKQLDADAMHEPRSGFWANMISPPSALRNARPKARSRRSTGSMLPAMATW